LALVVAALACGRAGAVVLTVNGNIGGAVNGDPIAGVCTGTLDTSGVLGASFSVPFSQWPPTFHPFAIRASVCTIVNGDALRPMGAAKNMFDLTGGNFSYTCAYSYPDLVGSGVTGHGDVVTVGDQMTYSLTIGGEYHGPSELSGVSNARVYWTRGPDDTILETGSGTVHSAAGAAFPINWSVTYSTGGALLPGDETGFISYTLQDFDRGTGELRVQYVGEIHMVPEPCTLALLAAGSLGLLGWSWRSWRRR
jgi:hypothetical protein